MSADLRKCAQHRELISALLDGDLTPDERAVLTNHLAGCAECRALLDSYRTIGASIRALPAAAPPTELTDAIYAATIDAEPRRLLFLTSKLGYSLAAVAAVALMFVVAGYLLVGGYQRGVAPRVASSQPAANVTWPTYKPIEINFNKPMNHQSVEDALAISPFGQQERLTTTWDGNTLIIGTEGQSLAPGSKYTIVITTDARDKWGKRLDSNYTLQFATQSTVAIEDTPTPAPTPTTAAPLSPTATANVTAPTATAGLGAVPVSPSPSAAAPTATPQATNPNVGVTPPGTDGVISTPQAPVTGPNAAPTSTPIPTPLLPPATPSNGADDTPAPVPTSTPTPIPTSVPVETPTSLPATSTPAPVATETPTPPAAAATETPPAPPTETPTTIPVTGVLGGVYWSTDSVQQRLGAPTDVATTATNQVLGFQTGNMYLRGDTNEIYVMVQLGNWDLFPNTATTEPAFEAGPEPGTWVPGGAFGVLWTNVSSVKDQLGLALSAAPTVFEGEFQQFAGGVMLSTPTDVLIFYNDASWDYLPITASADGADGAAP